MKVWLAAMIFILCWATWLSFFTPVIDTILNSGLFVLVGIIGAIFANSTGAGGGVIFVPVFSAVGFSTEQMISTSFAIQCFGMTAGSLSWIFHYRRHHRLDPTWIAFGRFCGLSALASISGLWFSTLVQLPPPVSIHISFSLFSIALGLIILTHSRKSTAQLTNHHKQHLDIIALVIISFIGGIVTSWLSVGVGEMLVIYLMLRGYCTKLAIATGVVVSAITVWSTAPITFSADSAAHFETLLFAGPAAIIGGLLAKRIALYFSIQKLKQFFSVWIILTGTVMLGLH
ncbi:sulfite exporter TauE/SafE family protein [Shewanella intestini]|uniref:Probable membrane transporter protein n=1 Tax=Shewanella intestini TaxID=2017544 RepID=A0ABS5HYC2_9GAMM|nr:MULTISPECIES: sulfite exporter TauE/SafE family protein [Shewanella]MBR9726706.1 sulfite exporter TauE/SafE family protein [Shewanella intestini]MRG34728.1 TSUP family transporter [Shewanella sp. XMDDZSB0408]